MGMTVGVVAAMIAVISGIGAVGLLQETLARPKGSAESFSDRMVKCGLFSRARRKTDVPVGKEMSGMVIFAGISLIVCGVGIFVAGTLL